MTGPFRLGWSMDYPSPRTTWSPLYSTPALPPAGSNSASTATPSSTTCVAEGNAAATNEEAIAAYQAAEDVLLEDMPSAPLFFGLEQRSHSENVDNVVIDVFGRIDAAAVTVVG